MNINVNVRNKKNKLLEKLKGYTYKMSYMSAAYLPRLQNLVPNKSWDIVIWRKWLIMRII